jgi:molybdopterin/thiamine biosynthesis adenylyltransferase
LKIDAVEDRILLVNPNANIIKFSREIQNIDDTLLKPYLGYDSVVIATCDSRYANNQASRLAYKYDTPFVSIAMWARAATGEIFYWIPGLNMPCYECYCGQGDMQRIEPSKQYIDEIEEGKVNFEPGLGMDIDFVSTAGCKFILDILNLGSDCNIRVFGYYKQYTVICNTTLEKLGQKKGLFSKPLEIKSYNYPKDPDCYTCGHNYNRGE